jgi:Tfp pilus assembly protein PilP
MKCIGGAVLLLMAVAAGAQTPTTRPAPQPSERNATPDTYTYDSRGRRDPFLSLVGTGPEPRPGTVRAEGAAGLTVDEISVRGIMQSRGVLIAMVQGPDNKTYLVHQGDKFVDGTVTSITPQGLVVVQRVNDPFSLVKQREIRKLLRSAEGAKP